MTVTPDTYDQALRLYRGGFVDDWATISEHTRLTEEEIEALVLEGGAGRPSFVRVLQDPLATAATPRQLNHRNLRPPFADRPIPAPGAYQELAPLAHVLFD